MQKMVVIKFACRCTTNRTAWLRSGKVGFLPRLGAFAAVSNRPVVTPADLQSVTRHDHPTAWNRIICRACAIHRRSSESKLVNGKGLKVGLASREHSENTLAIDGTL